MKKIFAFCFVILFSAVGFADEILSIIDDSEKNHRVFVKPDIFWSVQEEESSRFNYGIRGGYEYVEPLSPYFEIQGYTGFRTSSPHSDGKLERISNVGSAIGFNLSKGFGATLVPYAGIGRYFFDIDGKNPTSKDFTYGMGGLKINAAITKSFDIGINTKALRFLHTRAKSIDPVTKKKIKESTNLFDQKLWGYEASLPIVWHLNLDGEILDIQVEPYTQSLSAFGHQKSFGSQFMLGYFF